MKSLTIILICLMFSGCAAINKLSVPDIASSPKTFAVCKAVDVVTTSVALGRGGFIEANPLMALTGHPAIAAALFGIGIYELMVHYGTPQSNMVINAVSCGVSAHNLFLIK
jgi:hypothetical protein